MSNFGFGVKNIEINNGNQRLTDRRRTSLRLQLYMYGGGRPLHIYQSARVYSNLTLKQFHSYGADTICDGHPVQLKLGI